MRVDPTPGEDVDIKYTSDNNNKKKENIILVQ
jgi:hypothetical protein